VIYDMKAIPTTYAGVNFRSRLEARWAAFFDLCRWRWVYEPCDLNGWAPDFSIMKRNGGRVLVEVKPFEFRHWTDVTGQHVLIEEAYNKCLPHVKETGTFEIEDQSILLLGSSPFYGGRLGFVGMWAGWSGLEVSFRSAALARGQAVANDILPMGTTSPMKRQWDEVRGSLTVSCEILEPSLIGVVQDCEPLDGSIAEERWRESGNRTQWKK